jgi:membrane protein YdbS with pleckstrin-like domain
MAGRRERGSAICLLSTFAEGIPAMLSQADQQRILAITRPDPALLTLYIIYAVCSLVFFPFVLMFLLIKYYTLRYRFDDAGIRTSQGLINKQERVVQYARIQDLHVSRGLIERMLGLATVEIQTAAGAATPELTIVGVKDYDLLRDFLYLRMRGARFGEHEAAPGQPAAPGAAVPQDAEVLQLLREIRDEVRQLSERPS